MRLKSTALHVPWTIGNAAIETPGEESEIAECMNELVALFIGIHEVRLPVRHPFAGHDMLDSVLAARDSLAAETRFFAVPATQTIFDALENHPQTAASQAAKGLQVAEVVSQLCIV